MKGRCCNDPHLTIIKRVKRFNRATRGMVTIVTTKCSNCGAITTKQE